MIMQIYKSKKYIYDSLDEYDKRMFDAFINKTADYDNYTYSIKYLSEMMYKYYNKTVVILIDEYDVSIERGYIKGYYEKVVSLIKDVFSSSLKDNDYLDFSVMTGVLRVSKESLFSDFNNPKIYTIVDENYSEAFGFNENETRELLKYYDLELNVEVKSMYDGYNFGGTHIYNPLSILNYAFDKKLNPYWVNTSGNELIINSIKNCSENIKVVIEKLLTGDSVEFIYNDKITYLDYNNLNSLNNVLNLLFISGYLKIDRTYIDEFNDKVTLVKLPNKEVRYLFNNIITEILINDLRIENDNIKKFCLGILNDDKELIQNILNRILPNISYMDFSESFYHGYLIGLFSLFLNNNRFIVRSNRESGLGRFDIMIKDLKTKKGYIIELKVTDGNIEEEAIKGINQIGEKECYLDLVQEGYEVYKYALAFKDKMGCVK